MGYLLFIIAMIGVVILYIKWQKARDENIYLKAHIQSEKSLNMMKQQLQLSFQSISDETLKKNHSSFLNLAAETLGKFQEKAQGDLEKRQTSIEYLLKPVKESLTKLDEGMRTIEKERKGDKESLCTQLKMMSEAERDLRKETSTLVKALRMPTVRGQWGELQLKRVIELSGMVNHCDFYEQQSVEGDRVVRPDVIVKMPGNKQVVIDAKTPCHAYLEAIHTENVDQQIEQFKAHARQVRKHVVLLGKKSYWESFEPTPEFVVLFIPSDNFFNAALEYDPTLIEVGVEQGVVIATPTTLIGLLRAIAYGWKQDTLSMHAKQVSALGHELYKRLTDMNGHWHKMGRSLSSAVESYNKAVGSLESRVLVSARKFQDMGAASGSLSMDPLSMLEQIPKSLQAPDMQEPDMKEPFNSITDS